MRSGLALDGGIGGDDHFADLALVQAPGQQVQAQFGRPHAVQRRQVAEQHEIMAAIIGGLFDGSQIRRRLDHAQHRRIARGTGAQRAHRILAEIAAARTIADTLHGRIQRTGQAPSARAFALEQVKSHALRTLGPYPGQAAQRVHEFVEESGAGHEVLGMGSREWGVGKARVRDDAERAGGKITPGPRKPSSHASALTIPYSLFPIPDSQNGRFMPGGRFMPAVRPPIFSLLALDTLLTASLTAAATRSSAISGSSANSERSICTRRTSCAPVMVTLTMPPPALPVTSIFAISSCASFICSCMRWACCINCPIWPFMGCAPG